MTETIETNDSIEKQKERAFSSVILAGELLLKSGAEISRVEETMKHMADALHIYSLETYIIANGIFATAEGDWHMLRAQIKHVHTGETDLGKIEAVNRLSREMERGLCDLDEAEARLKEIERMGDYPIYILLPAYLVGAGCFCYVLGGSGKDALVSAGVGFTLGVLFMILGMFNNITLSKALRTMLGSMLVTAFSIVLYINGNGDTLSRIIVGGLMPMIPGVAFSSAIRDFVENDYISGMVRLTDVLLILVSMAVGVSIVWYLYLQR